MVTTGFHFTGIGDRVICLHCKVLNRSWEEDDYPEIEHTKWSNICTNANL